MMPTELSGRAMAYLRAVSQGRAEITCSCEPDMRIDGLCVCDQVVAHRLATEGLIQSGIAGTGATAGGWVLAELTALGAAAVGRGNRGPSCAT